MTRMLHQLHPMDPTALSVKQERIEELIAENQRLQAELQATRDTLKMTCSETEQRLRRERDAAVEEVARRDVLIDHHKIGGDLLVKEVYRYKRRAEHAERLVEQYRKAVLHLVEQCGTLDTEGNTNGRPDIA